MENKCNTTDVRERERLKLSLNKSASQNIDSEALASFTLTTKKEANFQIVHSKNFFIQDNILDLRIQANDKEELLRHLSNLEILNSEEDNDIHFHYNFDEDASHIFKSTYNIHTFLQSLNKSLFFRDFTSCQFLVHEKGQSQAFSLALKNEKVGEKKLISSLSFNNILTSIKKSKNKQFQVNEITCESLDIIGSFLAKEFEHKDFNFIILASRGGLFNTSKSDKQFFTHFLLSYQSTLLDIVFNTIKEFQNKKANLIVTNFPIYLKATKIDKAVVSNSKQEIELISLKINEVLIQYPKQNFLSTEAELYHQERIILMGELLNTLKHELSNPLFGIQIASEMLLLDEKEHDVDSTDLIQEIKKSASRCQNIINSFSDLYSEGNQSQNISLKSLIDETITLTKSETRFLKKIVQFDGADDFQITANATFLSQIIFNLVINSSQALKDCDVENKEIILKISEDTNYITMLFLDNGPGISRERELLIFTPFYTSKDTGTGLGLPICKKMAHKLGGDISYSNKYSPLTCFELKFLKVQEVQK